MIPIVPFILDILKFTIAGVAVFYVAFSAIRTEMERSRQLKVLDLKKSSQATTLPLRLQAYERIVLFIERINPASLLVRNHAPGLTVLQAQQMFTNEIQNEFQHNITQQLYVSNQAWAIVKRLKEDTISLINHTAQGLDKEAPSIELSRIILNHLAGLEENPYDAALGLIRIDIQEVF